MDDDASKANPTADFNKIDLSQLQGFSFGTQWAKDKDAPAQARDHSDRPHRDDRAGPGGAPDRRDRRAFRKPAGDAPSAPPREGQADRAPRRDSGDYGAPRRSGPAMDRQDRGPYDSPYFNAAFFPEDTSFNALVKMIRSSARTIELFEIARTVLGKPDRFVVVVTRRPRQDASPEAAPQPIHVSVPDGVPFESEEAAISYVLGTHLDMFFDKAEVAVDPPKGNFQVINKCGVTGELLGPPNYHRYNQMVQQHYAAKVSRMPFEAFKSRIETVRDPEVVNQWLEKMKKVTRYTSKAPVAEGQAAPAFDSHEEARAHLLSTARDTVVKPVESARFHGKVLDTMPRGEILMAIEGAYERQLRFPLDTANQLRGRLRREHFTIFKKGSKGVSYVCAVKRKFRVPGQAFGESIGRLISFIEEHPLVKAGELASKMLGMSAPAGGHRRHAGAEGEDHADAGRPDLARPRGLRDGIHRRRPLRAAGHGRGAQEGGRGRGERPREFPGGAAPARVPARGGRGRARAARGARPRGGPAGGGARARPRHGGAQAPGGDGPGGALRVRPAPGRLARVSAGGSSAGRPPRCRGRGARRPAQSIPAACPATRRRGTTGSPGTREGGGPPPPPVEPRR
jgi:hypothetical protein